jgi:hypothetical protein
MKVILALSILLCASCKSTDHDSASQIAGGREAGGVDRAPNVAGFRLRTPSNLPADQTPELAPILARASQDLAAGKACAVRKYQEPLGADGDIAPHVRIVFTSHTEYLAALADLDTKLDKTKVEIIAAGSGDCRAQLGDNGNFNQMSSEALITIMSDANVKANSEGGAHPSYTWESNVTCTSHYPEQNTRIPRAVIECSFGEGEDGKVTKSEPSSLLVKMLEAAKIPYQSRIVDNVAYTTWTASRVFCQQSTMERVAPGGGFTQKTISSCEMQP